MKELRKLLIVSNDLEEEYPNKSSHWHLGELRRQIKQLILNGVMDWVGVDVKLPEEHEDILVYYYGNRNSKHFPYLQFIKQTSFYNEEFECDEEVTHWAKLPYPPCA